MQILLALTLPVVVLLIAGLLSVVLDAWLTVQVVACTRPHVMPAFLNRMPLLYGLRHSCIADVGDTSEDTKALQTAILDNVNHEIRTPLAGIMATAQILHDEVGPHHQALTEMLVENSKRMNHAIGNVIALVALEEGEYHVDKAPVRMADEIASMLSLHMRGAASKGIDLKANPIQQNLTLHTDPQLLRKVLSHLIENAIKFTDEGSVQLSVKDENRWLRVEIKDTGVGLSKAFLPNIYKPFVQESTGLARSHNGQGLGLALTKRMIDIAGGTISVESKAGIGSTFTVSFPKTTEA